MKATGVVRRIDDVGRIVIPKEIRKNLRINDGELIEIFLDNENIVLKKYSPLEKIPNFYKDYADSIYSEIGLNVLIVDRSKIVAVAGDLKRRYLNSKISVDLDLFIQEREIVCSKEKNEICLSGEKYERASYVIAPIISGGDAIGAVIIMSFDSKINDFAIKTCCIAAKFLGKYVE